jgi:hypothetical protein
MDLRQPECVFIVICAELALPAGLSRNFTGQGQDFVSNIDSSIILALVQSLLSPISQIFVHNQKVAKAFKSMNGFDKVLKIWSCVRTSVLHCVAAALITLSALLTLFSPPRFFDVSKV